MTTCHDQAESTVTFAGIRIRHSAVQERAQASLPPDVFAVVKKQVDGAQRNHDQIRALINAARDCS